MTRIKRSALAIAAALCWAAAAQAAPITVIQTTAGALGIEQAHDETQNTGFPGYKPTSPLGQSSSRDGYRNGNVSLETGNYTLGYWGSGNSAQNNTFTLLAGNYTFTGGPIFSNGPGGLGGFGGGYKVNVTAASAILNFAFSTSGGCAPTLNGAAVGNDVCNYLAGADGFVLPAGTSANGNVAFLGYSDQLEIGDIDHQDLTVRIAVPEPGSLALVGAALAGLGFARRRKTS